MPDTTTKQNRNPLLPGNGYDVQWTRHEPFYLDELRQWLASALAYLEKHPYPVATDSPAPKREGSASALPACSVRRNATLFAKMVKAAHKPDWHSRIQDEGWAGGWLQYVSIANEDLSLDMGWTGPLPRCEVRAIAKSCAKYSIRQFGQGGTADAGKQRRKQGKPGMGNMTLILAGATGNQAAVGGRLLDATGDS